MPPFLYRCPNTGDIQVWAADDPEDEDFTHVQVTCLACAQAHVVNLKTGTEDDDEIDNSLHTNIAHVTVHSSFSVWDTAQSVAV